MWYTPQIGMGQRDVFDLTEWKAFASYPKRMRIIAMTGFCDREEGILGKGYIVR